MTDEERSLPTVECWPANGWTCDACGRDNLARTIITQTGGPPEVDDRSNAEITDSMARYASGEPMQLRSYVVRPAQDVLACAFCSTRYRLPDPIPLENDEDAQA